MNAVPTLVVSFLMRRLEADDDTDEDDDDEDDDLTDDDEDDEDDVDDDDEEPETWQVGSTVEGPEYPEQGTRACESPKRRLNLTFRPLAA